MNFLKRLFALFFDEVAPEEKPAEEPAAEEFKSLTDEEFSALSEEKQNEHLAKSVEHNFAQAEKPAEEEAPAEEPAEEEDPEAAAAALAAEDKENDDTQDPTDAEEDADLEKIEDPIIKKRLTDTQHAFRAARSENADLKKRLEELEKKVTPAPDPAKKGQPEELTLANIKPEVLAKAMKEDPVNTLRWVADQQVKQSLELNRKAQEKVAQEESDKNFVRASEDSAIKKFPVLSEILAVGKDPVKMAALKEKSKSKYEFGQKTAKYYKEFTARGDKEAFYNAAARAYVELSPQMIKDVQIETKRLAEQELANKKRVLGKVSVTGNKGGINQKGAPKHKSLTEEEFMKLTPAQQVSHWSSEIDAKVQK
jgi:hypothetical protein